MTKIDEHFLTFRIFWKLYFKEDLKDKRELFTFQCIDPGGSNWGSKNGRVDAG